MNRTDNKYLVNWIDGMKISKTHFIESENALINLIQQTGSQGLSSYNFGLLPISGGQSEAFHIEVSSEKVELHRCLAVTRGGALINIDSENTPALKRPFSDLFKPYELTAVKELYVVVKINSFERVAYGKPDENMKPLRNPYTIPQYELELVSPERLSSADSVWYAMPLAKITRDARGQVRDPDYIPPCNQVLSSRVLTERSKQYVGYLAEINRLAQEVHNRAVARRQKEPNNTLAWDIQTFAAKTGEFIANNYDNFRTLVLEMPPVFMTMTFARWARSTVAAVTFLNDSDYFLGYCNVYVKNFEEPRIFKTELDKMSNYEYNHFDVAKSIEMIENFYIRLHNLLEQLNHLEYKMVPKGDLVTRTWSEEPINPRIPPTGQDKFKIRNKGDASWF